MREGEREEGRGLPLDFAAVPTHADADVDVEKTVAFFFLPRNRSIFLNCAEITLPLYLSLIPF